MSKIKPLYELTVNIEREVEETNTKVEDGKTITETVKVKRQLNMPIAFKTPSRAEREEADIERAAWVNKYHERGLMLEAMLIKKYVDEGGTLPKQYQKEYQELQAELLDIEKKLIEAEIVEKDNPENIKSLRKQFFNIRERMIDIQRTQSQFFEDTAEAKARLKKVEWLTLHLSYYKPLNKNGEPEVDWVPFFKGETTNEKMEYYDSLVQQQDEILMKAKPIFSFLATIVAHESEMTQEEIQSYIESLD